MLCCIYCNLICNMCINVCNMYDQTHQNKMFVHTCPWQKKADSDSGAAKMKEFMTHVLKAWTYSLAKHSILKKELSFSITMTAISKHSRSLQHLLVLDLVPYFIFYIQYSRYFLIQKISWLQNTLGI